jgi:hypothetical protein
VTKPVPGGQRDRLEAVLGALEGLVAEFGREELPGLFAGLERVRRVAELRLIPVPPRAGSDAARPLLTADRLAELLAVSTAQVYRLAKKELRSAAIEVGEETLRFDPARVKRFLESRRRA